jgi:hypothetical protein
MGNAKQRTATALAVALIAAGTLVMSAGPASASTGSDCGAKKFRLLFWPKGHKSVPSVGFPEFLTPHLELYTGTGKKFPDNQEVAYADPTTSKVSATACTQAAGGTSKKATISKTTTKPTMLVCAFKSDPLVNAAQVVGGGYAILLYENDSAAAYAIMKDTGSSLQYDAKACKAKKPPH